MYKCVCCSSAIICLMSATMLLEPEGLWTLFSMLYYFSHNSSEPGL